MPIAPLSRLFVQMTAKSSGPSQIITAIRVKGERQGARLGVDIERRPRRDEPFNPFAPGASQNARKRKEDARRRAGDDKARSTPQPVAKVDEFAERQKKAIEALKNQQDASKKVVSDDKKPTSAKSSLAKIDQPVPLSHRQKQPQSTSREVRIAALKEKSAATVAIAEEAKQQAKVEVEVVIEPIVESESIVEVKAAEQLEVIPESAIVSEKPDAASNVFKTITTEIKKKKFRPRRRAQDKKGGGRQTKVKKLDRRKYLEYKYVARDLLDHEGIKEEHRSNVLGQIWAKGERLGVEDAVSFIDEKEAELILPPEIAKKFRDLVKKFTTRR